MTFKKLLCTCALAAFSVAGLAGPYDIPPPDYPLSAPLPPPDKPVVGEHTMKKYKIVVDESKLTPSEKVGLESFIIKEMDREVQFIHQDKTLK
jgi:hypothetical protein